MSSCLNHISKQKYLQFVQEAKSLDISNLIDISESRRYTLVACLVDYTQKETKDNLAKVFCKTMATVHKKARINLTKLQEKANDKTQEIAWFAHSVLGIPTVSDRIAQTVVKLTFEPLLEPCFLSDSYGYRPNKSALDAVGVTRQRCWRYDWVLEFDIKGLFDNIDHNLLMKAVRKHTDNSWVILYIERWLKAPMMMPDGALIKRDKGTSQGSSISPVLSNLFLHYVFDVWMEKNNRGMPWCRYADDGLVHCKTEQEAQKLLMLLQKRFAVYKSR